jgi:hypothetical protein
MVAREGGKWTVNFVGKNTGSGPNRPYKYTGELTGKEEGGNLNLTGEVVVQRQGPYVVEAVLAGNSLKATFKKKDGGGEGSFDLTPGKSEALAVEAEAPKPSAEAKPASAPAPAANPAPPAPAAP